MNEVKRIIAAMKPKGSWLRRLFHRPRVSASEHVIRVLQPYVSGMPPPSAFEGDVPRHTQLSLALERRRMRTASTSAPSRPTLSQGDLLLPPSRPRPVTPPFGLHPAAGANDALVSRELARSLGLRDRQWDHDWWY